ncbi:valine--tRNA ligase [Candidatus Berkelbacteria bacterium]|nr:valine--tRNA ligase [Candidatus Berkelbacteria bacterium]
MSDASAELPKHYDPSSLERELYERWENAGAFAPSGSGESFSIALPPPNVTGTLHIGHAFEHSQQDLLVRYHRMKGDSTLWVPGTDHAAIATQSRYEKQLQKNEGKSRHDFSRDEFFGRVQEFALTNQEGILSQLKLLGDSVDWSRLAFTLDEVRERAVRTAFTRMYDDGLIYRGHRIVNWDSKGQTTLADDEMVYTEEQTTFYYFKYGPFTIGTARPETKFADKYVVMHPDDDRYAEYKHGQTLELEWINGPITATVIKDESIDMAFGTGVMTITPWHSAVDFEMAERHDLNKEQIIDERGKLLPIAGEFAGMKIAEARPKIVEKLRAKGLLVKEEPYTHNIARSERTNGVIEPQVKLQWFVDVDKPFTLTHSNLKGISSGSETTLQRIMRTVVESGEITIVPEHFRKSYEHWVENLRDWCISRQILYGHRIPVWYKGDELHVGVGAPEGDGWEQDPDTLDTWFSSALWTFSTLGWPDETPDLKRFHPTSVINPGYEILTLWVSRMILMSGYLLGEVPFKTVLIHGIVRDKDGRKFSKSLNNGIDPLEVINEYGTDALRMSLIAGVAPGSDVKFDLEKVKGYKHFANKVWNISRFIRMRSEDFADPKPFSDVQPKTDADTAILAKLAETIEGMTEELERYQFHLAAERIYQFLWHEFADIYLEASKPQLDDHATRESTIQILHAVLRTGLALLHPFMPFITEGIWQSLPKSKGDSELLITQPWPTV